jgi:hypothetical protein
MLMLSLKLKLKRKHRHRLKVEDRTARVDHRKNRHTLTAIKVRV